MYTHGIPKAFATLYFVGCELTGSIRIHTNPLCSHEKFVANVRHVGAVHASLAWPFALAQLITVFGCREPCDEDHQSPGTSA